MMRTYLTAGAVAFLLTIPATSAVGQTDGQTPPRTLDQTANPTAAATSAVEPARERLGAALGSAGRAVTKPAAAANTDSTPTETTDVSAPASEPVDEAIDQARSYMPMARVTALADSALAGAETAVHDPVADRGPTEDANDDEIHAEARHASARAFEEAAKKTAEAGGEPEPRAEQRLEWPDAPRTAALLDEIAERASASLDEIHDFRRQLVRRHRENYLVLTPYVSDPRWAKAMQLLKDDDCKEALTLATEVLGPENERMGTPPGIDYVFARIRMCTPGKKTEGREQMETLANRDDVVGALARIRLGRPAKQSSDDGGWYLSEKLRQAKRIAARGKLDEALADLDSLRDKMHRSWDQYRCELTKGQILETAGRHDEAGATYLSLYRRTRGWKANSHVEDLLEKLERRTKKSFLSYGERIDRMRHLISRGRYRDARRVSVENAKLRGVSGREIRGWSFYRRALQAEHKKRREKAAKLFEKAEKLVEDSEVRPRLYFGWARALRRLDRDREAIELYERLCDEFARHHLCDDSLYEAGRLLQFLEDHDDARTKFAAVVGQFPDSEFVPDALWRGAFSLYLQGEYRQAIPPLKRIVRHHADIQDASELTLGLKASYWIGMSALRAGDRDMAEEWLQKTIDDGTLTWYGRLAVKRMEDAGMQPVVELPEERLTLSELEDLRTLLVPRNERLEVAAEFVRLGLYEDAVEEMKNQVAIHPVPQGAHRLLAGIHLANGTPNWAHWIMKKHIAESGPTDETLRDWGTAFPLNYMDLAHQFGTKFGVSPFLVQAIIRQESGFRPRVRSWAGAVGLMQLMPGTARYTANLFLDDARYRRRHLTKPETNVKLGTMYIRVHTAYAQDKVPLALAGYNAGPAPLESWIERYSDRELDAWVESITYREARGYVRKVFTSYVTYSALYGGELPPVEMDVPDELREWGDIPEVDRVTEDEPVSLRHP